MSDGDLLAAAVAELYSADPDEFIQRRAELAGQARAAGQPLAARQITALRKPTRSAWVINQMARSEPDAAAKLAELGERLRAAERSGDGPRMRELTQQRRQLIPSLVRQALATSSQSAATAALREEITATFAAALADPEVAEQIQQGTLLRSASRPGFGSGQAPLVLVPPLPDGGKGKAKPAPRPAAPAASPALRQEQPSPRQPSPRQLSQERQNKLALAAERREAKLAEAAARAQAQAQERQAKLRAAAEQALADADQAAAAASQDEREQADTVRRLEHELADARHRLRMASAEVRRAETAQHKARQALDRLPD